MMQFENNKAELSDLNLETNYSMTFQNMTNSQIIKNFSTSLYIQRPKQPSSHPSRASKKEENRSLAKPKLSFTTPRPRDPISLRSKGPFPSIPQKLPTWLRKRNDAQFRLPGNSKIQNSVFSGEAPFEGNLNVQKINKDFEDLLFNAKKTNPVKKNVNLIKKDNFSTCSEFNSHFNESLNSMRFFPSHLKSNKHDFFCKRNNQGEIQSKVKMNTDLISYSTVNVSDEVREFKNSTELVLENSYFGEVDIKVKMQRKEIFRNLLNNLENTFYFEKNSTATLKNFVKMDTLQILIRPTMFKKLSFQMKLTFFVWYWVKVVDHKWFRKTFESLMPKFNISSIKFIQDVTKA